MQSSFITTPTRKFVLGSTLAAAVVLAFSSAACTVTTSVSCPASHPDDCGGICVDTYSDPDNCGGCGITCSITEDCIQAVCTPGCFADNVACTADSDCCSNFCASDGLCGCIPTGNSGCLGNVDCCSTVCDVNGTCR